MAFKPVIEGKTCIIADQSGSGKTLAYLAPVVQRLRQEELQGLSKSFSRSPRVVILVPTAELASQVGSWYPYLCLFFYPYVLWQASHQLLLVYGHFKLSSHTVIGSCLSSKFVVKKHCNLFLAAVKFF